MTDPVAEPLWLPGGTRAGSDSARRLPPVRLVLAFAVGLVAALVPTAAHADATLLLAEPYGRKGAFNPAGHVGVYLSRVCAAAPTVLQRCEPGQIGAVLSRYNGVAGFDWLAVPLIPYLYAVERAEEAPPFADGATVTRMREEYRRRHLRDLIPDDEDGLSPAGNWFQLVGASYDRRISATTIPTSAAQDDEIVRLFNARDNTARFNLLFRNCADFARDVINAYYPKAIRSAGIADLGLTTPKQVARSLVRFSARNHLRLTAFVVPQVPGSRRGSRGARGVLESLLKTKKYAIPLTIASPWLPVGFAAGYLATGRFDVGRLAPTVYHPQDLEREALRAAVS